MKQALKILPLLTCSAIALGASAQEAAKPAATSDALVIKTNNSELANNMLSSSGEEAPELKDGQHYVLTLQAGGEWKVATADGKGSYMQVSARPKQLMEMFAEQVDQAKQMSGMMAGMMAAQGGMDADAVQKLMDDLLEFPNQLESVSMVVEGGNGNYQARGEITGFKTSGFAKMMGLMKATGKGVPDLGGKSAMTLAMDLAPAAYMEMTKPFLSMLPGLETKEAKAKMQKSMEDFMTAADGTVFMSMAEASVQMLMGTADSKKYATLLESPDFQNLQKAMMNNMDGKLTPKAVTHRDVALLKAEAEIDSDAPNPLATDGKMVTYTGVVGDYVMTVMKGGESAAKQTIDSVLDQKIKRKPLAAGAFAAISLQLAEFASMMSNGEADTEEMPKQIDVQLGSSGASLTFQVGVKK